jgi:hypothetical protein
MNRRLFLALALGSLLALQAGAAELRHESKRLGVSFQLPEGFLVGQPKGASMAFRKMAESMARRGLQYTPPDEAILIEKRLAEGQDLQALPRSDSPQIFLNRYRATEAETFRDLLKDSFRQKIGAWEIYVLPGAPGPYGEHGFYYLVPLKNQSILEILAPRSTSYPGDKDDKPTHYDKVIRRLIQSLEMIE